MDPQLEIALAIHEGACRIMAGHIPAATAVDASREAMRLIIPDLSDISFKQLNAAAASERLRHLAKDDDTFGWRKTVPTKNMTAAEEIERRGARDEKHS